MNRLTVAVLLFFASLVLAKPDRPDGGQAQASKVIKLHMPKNTDKSCGWRVLEALLSHAGHHDAARDASLKHGAMSLTNGDPVEAIQGVTRKPPFTGKPPWGIPCVVSPGHLPFTAVEKAISHGHPVLVSVDYAGGTGHAIAVVGLDKNSAWVIDPNVGGVQQWTRTDLERRWGKDFVVVYPDWKAHKEHQYRLDAALIPALFPAVPREIFLPPAPPMLPKIPTPDFSGDWFDVADDAINIKQDGNSVDITYGGIASKGIVDDTGVLLARWPDYYGTVIVCRLQIADGKLVGGVWHPEEFADGRPTPDDWIFTKRKNHVP